MSSNLWRKGPQATQSLFTHKQTGPKWSMAVRLTEYFTAPCSQRAEDIGTTENEDSFVK